MPFKQPTIAMVDSLTLSDLHANKGCVLVLKEVILDTHGAPEKSILAGIGLNQDTTQSWTQIRYHFGRKTWQLVHEQVNGTAMPTERVQEGLLPDLIGAFEKQIGVTLPDTRIVELGVGLYSSKNHYVSDNPFALLDGEIYHVVDKRGVGRDLITRVAHGQTTVAVIKKQDDSLDYIEPRLILSREEWLSLKHVPIEAAPAAKKMRL